MRGLRRVPLVGGVRARARGYSDAVERIEELELAAAENAALAVPLAEYVDGLERDVMQLVASAVDAAGGGPERA